MSLLANKAKFKSMKDQVQKQKESESGGFQQDPRILEYYNLKPGESMRVIILPDVNGSLFHSFSTHGGRKLNLKRGTKNRPDTVTCTRSVGAGDCEICNQMITRYKEAKDNGYGKSHPVKVTANRLNVKEHTMFSVVVLEAPFDVSYPDGNMVKLWSAPKDIVDRIFADVDEGEIDEATISSTPFVIRKSKGDGEFDTYKNSGFSRNAVTAEEEAMFEGRKVDLYDYSDLGETIQPKTISESEQAEWVAQAIIAMEESDNMTDTKDAGKSGGESTKSKLSEKLNRQSATKVEESSASDTPEPEQEQQEQKEEQRQMSTTKTGGSSFRDRLAGISK